MTEFVNLFTIAIAFFVAAASPGPATIAIAAVSMNVGRNAGLLFGFGLSIGLAFWGLVAATGMGALLQASGDALTILKLLGGAYLLWLAYVSAKSAANASVPEVDFVAGRRNFTRGLLLNLSNPKAVFAWMAVLTLGIGEASGAGFVIIATGFCTVLGFLIYMFYAVIFSTSGAMEFYRRARRWIDGAVAGLFALAGLELIRSALVRQT
ncbi:MAG: LysE family translocator [Pseudomonadota bacterium]